MVRFKVQIERRAAARRFFNPDAATVSIYDFLGNGEAQSSARRRIAFSPERLEYHFTIRGRDANAMISHRNDAIAADADQNHAMLGSARSALSIRLVTTHSIARWLPSAYNFSDNLKLEINAANLMNQSNWTSNGALYHGELQTIDASLSYKY